ncbi:MAG TPA: signal peptide peptidase SppA [Microvirga sp.]|jgi:protease-4|nr:signal peptide peptidase SppA [Microvirga sp.]
MSMDAEAIVDRRRLRRKLSFWRVLSVLALIAAVVGIGVAAGGRMAATTGGAHIARVQVDGFIGGSQATSDLLRRVGESRAVSGVVISINSPGGTTTGAEELYRNIRRLAERKPLVAFVDGTAASGGYITALAADRIVARETSLIGSIGVILQFPQASALLEKIGVGVEEIKSSPLKAEPSGYKPTPPEAREALQNVVNDTYEWFKGLVATRRSYNPEELNRVADGRVFNGRQALGLKLVDELGSERDAIAWLEREKGVRRDLPVRNWEPRSNTDFSLFTWAAFGADLLGLEGPARHLRQMSLVIPQAQLDGLLAVWHPAAEK